MAKKICKLFIREILVVTSAYARTLFGGMEGNQVSARRGKENVISSCGKSCDAFVQPAFFLAGNRTTNGMAIFVEFKNLFTLQTSFQVFHSIRILWP